MHTFEEAKTKMQDYIDFTNLLFNENYPNMNWEISIIDRLTKVYDFGWVFFYESGNNNLLAGNGPMIILKENLHMYQMMTSLDVEENIKLFLEDKNKLARIEKDDDGVWDTVNLT
jgi:hypothetical protein